MPLVMERPGPPKRFALLVGVNFYLDRSQGAQPRRTDDGNLVNLSNLRGCVNDVTAVRELLLTCFQLDELRVLTSSLSSRDCTVPKEPEELWPTFYNIRREFENVERTAGAGDLFFFYFSGHGAPLLRLEQSPTGRETDLSLMTMDYCCGGSALRGWVLNNWLERLNAKGIQVVVALDSCHSGGAWRNDGSYRTPKDWIPPPNLPSDEAAVPDTFSDLIYRNANLDMSWDINPNGFTLMAACHSDQLAAENTMNGKRMGAFTRALSTHFKNQTNAATSMYRTIRDHIAVKIAPQSPQVYGRDRLAFFGAKEVFSTAPLTVEVKGDVVSLPVGRVHGIKKGAQFVSRQAIPEVNLEVSEVKDCTSIVTVRSHHPQGLPQNIEVFPCRWSSDETFRVLVEAGLSKRFQEQLCKNLNDMIAGEIEVVEVGEGQATEADMFRVKETTNGGIDVLGPDSVVGYEGPVRGVAITSQDDNKRATQSALALSHLFRFEQILNLRDEAYIKDAPFQVRLDPAGGLDKRPPAEKEPISYTFDNTSEGELFLTVLILNPGFGVQQLCPAEDLARMVEPGQSCSFEFHFFIPDALKAGEAEFHRDIVRTVVTKGRQLSFKSLELPDIWHADHVRYKSHGSGRNAVIRSPELTWWIEDHVFRTTKGTC